MTLAKAMASISVALNTTELMLGDITFSGNTLKIFVGDGYFAQGTTIATIDLTFATPVPEPASLTLLDADLLGLGVAGRRRRIRPAARDRRSGRVPPHRKG